MNKPERNGRVKIDPARIRPEEPLFGDGAGLDSIDALDLTCTAKVPPIPIDQPAVVAISPGNPSSPHSYSKTWGSSVTAARNAGSRLELKVSDPITMVATIPQQHMCGLEASVMFPVYSAGDS